MQSEDKNSNPAKDTELTFEPEGDSENLKDPAAAVRKLKEQLKSCQKERQEYLDGWQRAKADYVNAKKEEEKERSKFVKFSQETLIKELLPALDSFHIAFGNKDAWEKVDLNWRMGVQHIYTQLHSVLQKNGVTLIEPNIGDPFDPRRHSSIETVSVSNKEEDGTVRETVQKGYLLHGKVVEPAKVRIGEFADSHPRENGEPVLDSRLRG
ncbi:MAG: nucleotide exchange factor GrpE [bacterium]|nr:nucleotide exchange factor GrpE [bacterium]